MSAIVWLSTNTCLPPPVVVTNYVDLIEENRANVSHDCLIRQTPPLVSVHPGQGGVLRWGWQLLVPFCEMEQVTNGKEIHKVNPQKRSKMNVHVDVNTM